MFATSHVLRWQQELEPACKRQTAIHSSSTIYLNLMVIFPFTMVNMDVYINGSFDSTPLAQNIIEARKSDIDGNAGMQAMKKQSFQHAPNNLWSSLCNEVLIPRSFERTDGRKQISLQHHLYPFILAFSAYKNGYGTLKHKAPRWIPSNPVQADGVVENIAFNVRKVTTQANAPILGIAFLKFLCKGLVTFSRFGIKDKDGEIQMCRLCGIHEERTDHVLEGLTCRLLFQDHFNRNGCECKKKCWLTWMLVKPSATCSTCMRSSSCSTMCGAVGKILIVL